MYHTLKLWTYFRLISGFTAQQSSCKNSVNNVNPNGEQTFQYNQMSDYWNQSRKSITGSGLLTTYAHGYCHGCQNLENCNFHMDLWHL